MRETHAYTTFQDYESKPRYKYIVEGANLFITQQARLFLERRKCVLFKDSSANKVCIITMMYLHFTLTAWQGGVSCSSLDVLAGLSLTDDEHTNLMTFPDQKVAPAFYQSYVKDIQDKICQNATLEFSCLWKEHARLGGAKCRTILSDELSTKINELQTELESSDLFDDLSTQRTVLNQAIPQVSVSVIFDVIFAHITVFRHYWHRSIWTL